MTEKQHTHVFPDEREWTHEYDTPDDGEKSTIVPEKPLPDDATETEKEITEE